MHVVLDHHNRYVARDPLLQLLNVAAFVDGKSREGFVEQQELGLLRERHGDLNASSLAVRGLREWAFGNALQPDMRKRFAGALDNVGLTIEIAKKAPAQRRQAEQSQRDVVQNRLARK